MNATCAEMLVIPVNQLPHYASPESGEDTIAAVRRLIPQPIGTQGMRVLRAWFADDFHGLPPNRAADVILRGVGYTHPSGWAGMVVLTMEGDNDGNVPPLTNQVRATLDRLVAEAAASHRS